MSSAQLKRGRQWAGTVCKNIRHGSSIRNFLFRNFHINVRQDGTTALYFTTFNSKESKYFLGGPHFVGRPSMVLLARTMDIYPQNQSERDSTQSRLFRLYSVYETAFEFSVAVLVLGSSFLVSILARKINVQDGSFWHGVAHRAEDSWISARNKRKHLVYKQT